MLLEKIVDDPDEIPDAPGDDPELLWHLYRERGWEQSEIAFEWKGCDKSEVLEALIRHNILQPWSEKETLESALEEHGNPEAVAEAWSCSPLTIRRWMDRKGIKKRPRLTEHLLTELYERQNLTAEEIADDLGYAPVEVQMALREHGIETRSGSHRFTD